MNKVKTFSTEKNVYFVRYLCDDGQFHDFYFDPSDTSISYASGFWLFDCTVWENGLAIDKTYQFAFSRIRTLVINDLELFEDKSYDD